MDDDDIVCGCGLLRKRDDHPVHDDGYIYCNQNCSKKNHRSDYSVRLGEHYQQREAIAGDGL